MKMLFPFSIAFLSLFFMVKKEQIINYTNDHGKVINQANLSNTYVVPRELLFTGKRPSEKFPNPLYTKFFPIGWSTNGHFAYIEEPADEACGCYFFNIIIKNMTTNKEVWKWSFNGQDMKENLKSIWRKNKTRFAKKLNEYGIVQSTFNKLEKLPFKLNQKSYNFMIKNDTFTSVDFGVVVIKDVKVFLKSNHVATKIIFEKNYTTLIEGRPEPPLSGTLSNKISGYLKSPYENKIAVFYEVENRGWEGPPNTISFELIGCEFKKN
jgi:hypothetical protein